MVRKPIDGRGPFFTRLGNLLEGLEAVDLRLRITEYARGLDEKGRRALLDGLASTPSGPEQGSPKHTAPGGKGSDKGQRKGKGKGKGGPARAGHPSKDPLLRDIEAFAKRVLAGEYMEGWGWDPEIHDERAWGDESWTWGMGDLFAQAEEAFLAGDRLLATEAYEALFQVFLRDADEPLLPGAGSPEEMVEADLARAKACYLRAVYETVAAEERPGRLLGALRDLHWVSSGPVGITNIADADAHPLPGFELFLREWVALLEDVAGGEGEDRSYGWGGTTVRWLLREAVALMKGLEGLADLARRSGARHPEAYHDWIDRLLAEERPLEALSAAREGVEGVAGFGERAALADAAGVIARHVGNGQEELEARRAAWRTWPTGRRLRSLIRSEDESGVGHTEALARELSALQEGKLGVPSIDTPDAEDSQLSPRLQAALELLNGRFDLALLRLQAATPLGWSHPHHPGPLVFPSLLAAGAGTLGGRGAGKVRAGSALAGFLEGLDRGLEQPGWGSYASRWKPGLPSTQDEEALPSFRELLSGTLERHPQDSRSLLALLEEGERTARERVRAIVSNKRRNAYERAAMTAAAAAEAWCLANGEARGKALLAELRGEFSRYSAFIRELRSVASRSPLLRV